MRKRTEPSRLAIGAATIVVLIALWYVATSATHILPPVYFPTPAEVLRALEQISLQGYADGRLHEHFLHSSWLVLMGFAAAIGIGYGFNCLLNLVENWAVVNASIHSMIQ